MSILARSSLVLVCLLSVCVSLGCHQPSHEPAQPQEQPQAIPPVPLPRVRAELSSGETQVGIPVFFKITVEEAKVRQSPTLPPMPDMKVGDAGSMISTRNGRTTSTYRFELIPQKAGRFAIPPVTVQAGDRYYQTEAFAIVVLEPRAERVPVEIKNKHHEGP